MIGLLLICIFLGVASYFIYLVWKKTIYKLNIEIDELNILLVKRTDEIKKKNKIIKELKEGKCQNVIPMMKKEKK